MIPQTGDRVTVDGGTAEYIYLGTRAGIPTAKHVVQGPTKRRYVPMATPLHIIRTAAEERDALDAIHEERAGRR